MRNFNTVDYAITVLMFILVSLLLIIFTPNSNNRKMVSYEYTTQCRCGGTIEGYQSLVDGFNQEECSKCGYHKEGK